LFPEIFKTVHQLLPSLWASKRGPKYPQKFTSPKSLLGSMRLLKDPEELDMMKKAQEIANHAHRLAMAYANPGKNEGQIQAMLEMVFKNEGAFGEAYGSIVAGGDNANILHYIENNQVLKAGELLLIDAGPEYQYYAADITRTFPISGQFSSEQKVIYEIVLKAQENSIKHIKAGAKLSELHEISCRHLIEGLKDLKILNGSLEENLLSPFFKELYPHSTSHWLGLDVHDLGPYREETSGNELLLQENMILTVEPGLYFSQNNTQVPEKFRGIGIRIEDDIRVLQSGFENLSAAIPKKITDIEEACAQNSMDYLKKI
jgi:Xaa-Pro aminopeptidase